MIRRLLIVALSGLALAGPAAAAPSLQSIADRVEDQLGARVGFTPVHRPVGIGGDAFMKSCAGVGNYAGLPCVGLAYVDHILFDAWTARQVRAAVAHSRHYYSPIALHTVVHEELHLVMRFNRDDYADDELNEGIVDAVAADMDAPVAKAILGDTFGFPVPEYGLGYPNAVHTVRKASAAATHSAWRSRAARLLRRSWLFMDSRSQHAAVEAALNPEVK